MNTLASPSSLTCIIPKPSRIFVASFMLSHERYTESLRRVRVTGLGSRISFSAERGLYPTSAPHQSRMSVVAAISADLLKAGSTVLENLKAASEFIPKRLDVWPTLTGEKLALSITIVLVSGLIPVCSPPITPASAIASPPDVMSMSRSVSVLSLPSSVIIRSPSCAALTVISRAGRVLRSKA